MPELLVRVATAVLDANQLRKLLDDDVERDPEDKPFEHWLGNEVGNEAELQKPCHQEEQAEYDRDRRGQHHELLWIGDRKRRDGRGENCRRSRGRRDRELTAGPENRVGEQAESGGVESGLGRQAGDPGVAHRFGNEQSGERDAGDHVAAEVRAPVLRQPVGDGKKLHASYRSTCRSRCSIARMRWTGIDVFHPGR